MYIYTYIYLYIYILCVYVYIYISVKYDQVTINGSHLPSWSNPDLSFFLFVGGEWTHVKRTGDVHWYRYFASQNYFWWFVIGGHGKIMQILGYFFERNVSEDILVLVGAQWFRYSIYLSQTWNPVIVCVQTILLI